MWLFNYLPYLVLLLHVSSCSNVLEVNDKNFEEVVINSGKLSLVDFYADWCRHCKKLEPTYLELGDLFEDFEDIQILKINGDKDGKRMSRKYKLEGYPSIFFFRGENDPVEFNGKRDIASLSNFVQQLSGVRLNKEKSRNSIPVDRVQNFNDKNFDQVATNQKKSTVIFFSGSQGSSQEFGKLVKSLANLVYLNDESKIQFGMVGTDDTSVSLRSRFNVKDQPLLIVVNSQREKIDEAHTYNGYININDLVGFINDKVGLHRDPKGRLLPSAGRIQHLDRLVAQALSTDKKRVKSGVMQELFEFKNGLNLNSEGSDLTSPSDDLAMTSYYYKVISALMEDGIDTLQFEFLRLVNILKWEKQFLKNHSADSMQKRLNIINEFISY